MTGADYDRMGRERALPEVSAEDAQVPAQPLEHKFPLQATGIELMARASRSGEKVTWRRVHDRPLNEEAANDLKELLRFYQYALELVCSALRVHGVQLGIECLKAKKERLTVKFSCKSDDADKLLRTALYPQPVESRWDQAQKRFPHWPWPSIRATSVPSPILHLWTSTIESCMHQQHAVGHHQNVDVLEAITESDEDGGATARHTNVNHQRNLSSPPVQYMWTSTSRDSQMHTESHKDSHNSSSSGTHTYASKGQGRSLASFTGPVDNVRGKDTVSSDHQGHRAQMLTSIPPQTESDHEALEGYRPNDQPVGESVQDDRMSGSQSSCSFKQVICLPIVCAKDCYDACTDDSSLRPLADNPHPHIEPSFPYYV